ncbi:unnamed protein product, partial [Brachionus calyciflorus]
MAFTSITPIKVGIKFEPPALVLVYRDKSKLRNRTIPAKNLDILSDITLYSEKFKNDPKNKKYFEKITLNKLEKMFFILQSHMKGYTLDEGLDLAKKFDKSFNESDSKTDLKNKSDYDDDDFHDTDDEEKPSVSSLDDIKAEKNKTTSLFETRKLSEDVTKPISKSTALDLLNTQMKTVKSNFYDFEDEVEDDLP